MTTFAVEVEFVGGYWPPSLKNEFGGDPNAVFFAVYLENPGGPGEEELIRGHLGLSPRRRLAVYEDASGKGTFRFRAGSVDSVLKRLRRRKILPR